MIKKAILWDSFFASKIKNSVVIFVWGVNMSRKELGRKAENIAIDRLNSIGYKILETNFTCKIGEIDIIAEEDSCLVFVEVRSKKNNNYGFPQETINLKKQNKIKKVALYYLKINNLFEENCRFDVVAIIFNPVLKVEIIKNAFY